MKVWVKTPWARSRASTLSSMVAASSAARPAAPTPAALASAATPCFQASKSPPHSCAIAGKAVAHRNSAARAWNAVASASFRDDRDLSCSPKPNALNCLRLQLYRWLCRKAGGRPGVNGCSRHSCGIATVEPVSTNSVGATYPCGFAAVDRCQRVFCRSHLFQAASLPLKTLMSALPVMPGTMPVPVYCQKVKGWLPYLSRGWPATERSQ